MPDISITYRNTSELIPYARNSRTHSEAQVAQIAGSIREFGFANPVLIDGENGIIAGHGRLLAAQKLNIDTIPCIVLDHLTKAQQRALVIADNKLAMNAGWDNEMLSLELGELKGLDVDLELIGFSAEELAELTSGEGYVTEGQTDEDETPEPTDLPVTKRGDVWILGTHRLICGDSTSVDDLDTLMQGDIADMVWTDPPYNVAIEGAAGTIMNDDMSDEQFKDLLSGFYSVAFLAIKPGGVIYVAHADTERINFTQSFISSGFKLSQVLVWVKQSGTLSRQDFNWQHEPILYGWKEGAAHYFCGDFTRTTIIDDDLDLKKMTKPQLQELVNSYRSGLGNTAVRENRPTRSNLHPTMKPVNLVQRMVEWSSRQGETVLDLFGGSGSTLIACEKTGREARLMELDPKYCDVIVTRWENYTGKKAHLESNA